MRLNKFNESLSLDGLKERVEESLVELVDNGYEVTVYEKGNNRLSSKYKDHDLVVVIGVKRTKYTWLKNIYNELQQFYELMEYYKESGEIDIELKGIDIVDSEYSYDTAVKFLDRNVGGVTDASLSGIEFSQLRDSIDFAIFSNDCREGAFKIIKLYFS